MKPSVSTALVLVLCLLHISCAETHTFEGTLEASEVPDSRTDYRRWRTDFPRLTVNTTPDDVRDLMLEINHFGLGEGLNIGWLRLIDRDRDKITNEVVDRAVVTEIFSGDQRLQPRDLRMGQKVRVSYTKARIPGKSPARLEIVNYSPPPKILRVSVSLDVRDLTSDEAIAFEESIITILAWRLPNDIKLAKAEEMTDGSTVVGELSVEYFRFRTESKTFKTITFGSVYLKEDVIWLETKFSEPYSHCNWSPLRVNGSERVKQGENQSLLIVNDMAITRVPFFQMD